MVEGSQQKTLLDLVDTCEHYVPVITSRRLILRDKFELRLTGYIVDGVTIELFGINLSQ